MEKKSEELLAEVYRNCQLALESISDILPGVDDAAIKEEILRQHEEYEKICSEAAQIAAEAKPKQLWLTHFSPANPEPENFLEQVRKIFPETVIGRDGMFVQLRFPE